MSYFIYIVRCADNSLYCGSTTDVSKRVVAHNTSKTGAKYTRGRRPVTLVYSQEYETKNEALKQEYVIKSMTRHKKLQLIKDPLLKAGDKVEH